MSPPAVVTSSTDAKALVAGGTSPEKLTIKGASKLVAGAEFAEKLSKDALSLGAETKLRGSDVTSMLQQAGYTFSSEDPNPVVLKPIDKGGKASSLYDLSKDVDEIDAFVSHSWRDGRLTKFLSLAIHFRAWNAMLWALVPTVVCFIVQHYLAQRGLLSSIAMDPDHGVMIGGFCHKVWGAAFLSMLFWGAPTPWRPIYCFLDRLCIHQTDPKLKQIGIDSLGGFLAHSKRMVVIYSSSYITRLWCIFELAAKVRTHGVSAIDVMPTAACTAIGTPCIMCLGGSLGLTVCAAAGFASVEATMQTPWAVLWLSIAILNCAMPFRMAGNLQKSLRQTELELSTLAVKDLQCFAERDRNFVEGCILRWYGSISAFESTVHEELLIDLKRRGFLRKAPCFTYSQACIIYFHTQLMQLDTFAFTDASLTLRRLPTILAMSFTLQPLLLAFYCLVAEGCFQLHAFATRKVHPSIPKGPIWFVGFFISFIAANAYSILVNVPNGWSLATNVAWNLPVAYLCFRVYAIDLPKSVWTALAAASVAAIAFLAHGALQTLPPAAACHFHFPKGCVPSNEATASCTFDLAGAFGSHACIGVAA